MDNDVANATTDDAPWDVVLRHSTDSAAWAGTQLRLATDAESEPQCLNASRAGTRQYYYAASLQFSETVQFTLKYRRTPEAEWTWAHDEQGIADGTLVVKATRPLTDQLDSLVDLSPGWDVTECLSQTPRTQLWSLRGNVPSEDGHDGTPSHDICIGAPRAPFLR